MKNAIIYARVSTKHQADGELPIASQIAACTAKVEKLGANILRTFSDEGLSGSTDARPAFLDAITYCDVQAIDYFVTWSSSRFARNKVDAGFYKKRLSDSQTTLIYVSIDVDTATTPGWLLDGVLELFDELYSRQISADTRRSAIKNARDGFWNGGCLPYGFSVIPAPENPKRKQLQVDPYESGVVQRIFKMRSSGVGIRKIVKQLNDEGAQRRGHPWRPSALANLLRSQSTCGFTVYNKKDRRTGRIRHIKDWIIVKSHAAIVEKKLWDDVQKKLDRAALNAQPETGSPHSTHLLTGLLKCGVSRQNYKIESAKGRSRRYWYYGVRFPSGKPRRLPADDLDRWLAEHICTNILTNKNLLAVLSTMEKCIGQWESDRAVRRSEVLTHLSDRERRRRNLYEILEACGIDGLNLADLKPRLLQLNKEIIELESKVTQIESEIAPELNISRADVPLLCAFLKEKIKNSNNPKKIREFFSRFINNIQVGKKKITINYSTRALLQIKDGPKLVPGTSGAGSQFYFPLTDSSVINPFR